VPPEGFAEALDATIRLACVGLVLTGLELFFDRRAFDSEGPFSPTVFASLRGHIAGSWTVGSGFVAMVASTQVLAAIFLIAVGPFPVVGRIALCIGVTTSMILRWRRAIGGDGAEQLTVIVLVVGAAALVPLPGSARVFLAVAFIAAQTLLAYVTAGLSKLVSPVWRSGTALPAILGTTSHGQEWAARMLHDHPRISMGLTWSVIFLEVMFPLLLLGPLPLAFAVLAASLLFHIGCALLMGLNSFVWAFPATYPCLLAARAQLVG